MRHTLVCEECGRATPVSHASLICRKDDPPEWKVGCVRCSTSEVYWIDLREVFTKVHLHDGGNVRGPAAWDEHLSEKYWYDSVLFFAAAARVRRMLAGLGVDFDAPTAGPVHEAP